MKQCTICKEIKSADDFSFRNKLKGIKHTHCKVCQRKASNKHYKNNKDLYIERATKWNKNNIKRKSIAHNSYAKKKGVKRCKCCSKNQIDLFIQHCPKGYDIDHIIPIKLGGKHCLKNLQYLTEQEHNSKSARGF